MESSHISALQLKHQGLERQIRDEQGRPSPDEITLQSLKKKKLQIKQELLNS
jgi:hypothetical protein